MKRIGPFRTHPVLQILFLFIPLLLVVPPMFGVFVDALEAKDGFSFLPDARQFSILLRSLGISSSVAVLSMLLGGYLAFLAWDLPRKAQKAVLLFFIGILLVPPYIQALAWTEMLGKGGLLAFLNPWTGIPKGIPWCVFLLTLI